jgi:hypothetical protein
MQPSDAQQDEQIVRQRRLEPLIDYEAESGDAVELHPGSPLVTTLTAGQQRSEIRGRSEISDSQAQEPGEVQIHIGRIEVTAVAPPPVLRVPKASKTPSLDEYLQRRHAKN